MRRLVILSVLLTLIPQHRGNTQIADEVQLQSPLSGFISSVFDHDSVRQYDQTLKVVAFTGETGERAEGAYEDCYQNRPKSQFILYDNYSGISAAGSTFLCYDGHPGVDIVAPRGTAVVAAADGWVEQVVSNIAPDEGTGYGNFVIIRHASQLTTLYGHLLNVANHPTLLRRWQVGDQIFTGQTIGFVDSTGQSSGDHLHFEVRRNGVSVDPYGWKGWLLRDRDPYTRGANVDLWRCDFSVAEDADFVATSAIENAFQNVHAAVAQRFGANGGKEVLGCPSDPIRVGQQSFRGTVALFQNFHNGAIEYYDAPGDGNPDGGSVGTAFTVLRPLLSRWSRSIPSDCSGCSFGGGALGYPIAQVSDIATSSKGTRFRFQNFEGGALELNIDGPRQGLVFEVHGGIFAKWASLGFAASELGLPVSDEREAISSPFGTQGRASDFEGGHIHWHWNGVRAGQAFETHGFVDQKYVTLGGTASPLGFPISDVLSIGGAQRVTFESGFIECPIAGPANACTVGTTPPPPPSGVVSGIELYVINGATGEECGLECVGSSQFQFAMCFVGIPPLVFSNLSFGYTARKDGNVISSVTLPPPGVTYISADVSCNSGPGGSKRYIQAWDLRDLESGTTYEIEGWANDTGRMFISHLTVVTAAVPVVELVRTISTGDLNPLKLALSDSGHLLFVTHSSAISVFNTDPDGNLVPVAGSPFSTQGLAPHAIDVTGGSLFLTNQNSDTVSVFSISPSGALTPQQGSPFSSGPRPNSIVSDPPGVNFFVTNRDSQVDSAQSVSFFTLQGVLNWTPVSGSPFPSQRTNLQDMGIAIHPSRLLLFVSMAGPDEISVFTWSGGGLADTLVPVPGSPFRSGIAGGYPKHMVVSPDGSFLFVANESEFFILDPCGLSPPCLAETVSVFRIEDTGGLTPVAGAPFPIPAMDELTSDIAVSPTGRFLFTAYNTSDPVFDAVSAYQIDASTGALTPVEGSPFPTGGGKVRGIAVSPSGDLLYVTNSVSKTISVFRIREP